MQHIISKINDILRATWQGQLAAGLVLLLSLLLLFSFFSQIIDGYRLTQLGERSQNQVVAINKKDDLNNLKAITAAPVFGKYIAAKEERINTTLKLLGIIGSPLNTQRIAFISEPDKDANAYHEGDEIAKGLKVKRIFDDRVSLVRYGSLEVLYLAWGEKNASNVVDKKQRSYRNLKRPTFDRENYMKKLRDRYKGGRGL